jgi:hypothetical protein
LSQETERIPVPTNGKGPHPMGGAPPPPDLPEAEPPSTVTFTPTQLAVGFGIIASLILLVASRLRRNRQRRRWPLG